MTQRLFTDGGCVRTNPSPIGGTWAWLLVEDDQAIASASGFLPSTDCPVSNNVAELEAAVRAVEALPIGWQGRLCSDSQVTLGRLFQRWPLKGVPLELYRRVERVRLRLVGHLADLQVEPRLLQGHPTKADLAAGVGRKRGLPVSKWNVRCDEMCQAEARKALERQEVLV